MENRVALWYRSDSGTKDWEKRIRSVITEILYIDIKHNIKKKINFSTKANILQTNIRLLYIYIKPFYEKSA